MLCIRLLDSPTKLTAAIALLTCISANACSCAGEESRLRDLEKHGFGQVQGTVFHGRVVKYINSKEVGVEVLETFSGRPGKEIRLNGGTSPSELCGGVFGPKEEVIYFSPVDQSIGLCSKIRVSASNLERMRRIAKAESFPLKGSGSPRVEMCKRLADEVTSIHRQRWASHLPASQPRHGRWPQDSKITWRRLEMRQTEVIARQNAAGC